MFSGQDLGNEYDDLRVDTSKKCRIQILQNYLFSMQSGQSRLSLLRQQENRRVQKVAHIPRLQRHPLSSSFSIFSF